MGFYNDMKVSKSTLATVNMLLESSNDPYHPLQVALAFLRYLSLTHQANHWTCSGDPFYGDHQLFSKLYELTTDEIDKVAEKAVGLGSPQLVNVKDQLISVCALQESNQRHFVIPRPDELIDSSLVAEATFLYAMKIICSKLNECGAMTQGLDNLLAGIMDSHENSFYLLKQRSLTSFSI